MMARSGLDLMGKFSRKYKQTPPFLVSSALSARIGSGEKPSMEISALEISLVREDSQIPKKSNFCSAWNASIRGILAYSRAGKLSRFQTAKDNFFSGVGPGFFSTPAIRRRALRTVKRKKIFLKVVSVCTTDIHRGT